MGAQHDVETSLRMIGCFLSQITLAQGIAMGRRNKPHDPSAAIRAANERIEREQEIKRLKAQGAEVTQDRTGQIVSARRSNVFSLLLARGSITQNHHDAAYDLAKDWAAMKGLDGKPDTFGGAVDGGSGCAELITDRMIRAGNDVRQALAQIPDDDAKLMRAFMVATVEEDRPMAWRGIVQRELQVTDRAEQTRAVSQALESLRQVYEGPRRIAA